MTKIPKQLSPKQVKRDPDKTIVMSEHLTLEEAFFPRHVADRYAVKRFLGKGSFGMVYLAEDRRIGRLVAIKQLFNSYVQDSEIHERFIQEARIGSQLDHPNIINVFALEEDYRSACIIMEYLGGGSLEAYIDESAVVEPAMALGIFRGIMTGLDAAHKVMVVHRDIKPPNILFDHFGIPKISDFGIAYLPVAAGGAKGVEIGMDSMIGTPRYMSPEQVSGVELDFRTDLYSAGVVLYEMLTGKKIFQEIEEMEDGEICEVILHRQPAKPENDIPLELLTLMTKLLEKNREDRYQSAESVLSEIEKISLVIGGFSNKIDNSPRVPNLAPSLNSPVAVLEDVVRLFLVDGVIAPSERRELNRRAEKLGISPAQSKAIEDRIRAE